MSRRQFMGYAIWALELIVLAILVYVVFFMK